MKEYVDLESPVEADQNVEMQGSAAPMFSHSRVAVRTSRQPLGRKSPRLLMAANVAHFFKKFLLPYASHFKHEGWQVDAMANGFGHLQDLDWPRYYDNIHEVHWARKPHRIRGSRGIVEHIRHIADKGDYDIIHVHTPVAAMMTRYAMRKPLHKGNTQIIYTAHGFHFFKGASPIGGSVYKNLERLACRWTDFLVVMNQEDYDAARSLNMVPEERLRYMPGIGIDLRHYSSDALRRNGTRDRKRAELGLTDETLFTCIAEFIPRKRQRDILLALSRIEDPRVRVAFAGAGETLEKTKSEARSLGVADRTIFLGNQDDIPAIVAASEATVLPSAQEGLPRSIMESMAGSVPVIATNVRGCRDLLATGGGILYEVGDVNALADAMRRINDNPSEAKLIGATAEKAVRQYDFEKVLEMHQELYRDALIRGKAYAS